VASADPSTPPLSYGGALPSDTPAERGPEDALARVPADTGSNRDPVPPPATRADTLPAEPETVQASVSQPPLPPSPAPDEMEVTGPDETEVTGAVNKQANLADDPAPPSGLIDLNKGSFEALNTLKGGGPIGRAIIRGRPYASAEDLVKKKVLRRPVYNRIKDQITVR
jgi:DNA uptake protein ComE-like DNA-binding protein